MTKVDSVSDRLIELLHILINDLSKLNFLMISGAIKYSRVYDRRFRDLQKSNTRSFQMEAPNTINEGTLLIWSVTRIATKIIFCSISNFRKNRTKEQRESFCTCDWLKLILKN